jgi:DNA helicase-2/ATP-dependent DNA helicase PcrA
VADVAWPAPLDPDALARRRAAADLVRAQMRRLAKAGDAGAAEAEVAAAEVAARPADPELPAEDAARVAAWDRDLGLLLTELSRGRRGPREVPVPASLSASQVLLLASEPDVLAAELARPMPRPPAPQARRGTRFHAWVESQFAQQPLLDQLPGAADAGLDDAEAEELAALQKAFLRTPYASRRPYRVEAPFSLVLGGRVVRGRIDAVYETLGGYEVVDWKTSRRATADPLQLAVYRLAWAEIAGVDLDAVDAAFLYVPTGKLVRPPSLPGRTELESLLAGTPHPAPSGA